MCALKKLNFLFCKRRPYYGVNEITSIYVSQQQDVIYVFELTVKPLCQKLTSQQFSHWVQFVSKLFGQIIITVELLAQYHYNNYWQTPMTHCCSLFSVLCFQSRNWLSLSMRFTTILKLTQSSSPKLKFTLDSLQNCCFSFLALETSNFFGFG